MEIPEDITPFLEELERGGISIRLVAVKRTRPPIVPLYDVWVRESGGRGWRYVGVHSGPKDFRERDFVVCDEAECFLFLGDRLSLIYSRGWGEVREPSGTVESLSDLVEILKRPRARSDDAAGWKETR